jgi:aflatoxin B1 aldehyde reductase
MAIKAVFGGGGLGSPQTYPDDASVQAHFEALKREGVDTIDTAQLYPGSEERIGRVPGHEHFTIDTKLFGGFNKGTLVPETILSSARESLSKCAIRQFDILYIHAPDTSVPLEPALEAINQLHKEGLFRRFGLSNFTAEQVQEVYDICKQKGWVLPSVYQGNYNPVARKLETLLFPTLRRLGMAFYAYSPLAGGFLTKTAADIDAGAGRFNEAAVGGLYLKLYNRPSFREALSEWNEIAEMEGVSKAELAYRWVAYHGALKEEFGDAVIFGARTIQMVEETARGLKKGRLSETARERIEGIWKKVEKEAPVDNFQVFSSNS